MGSRISATDFPDIWEHWWRGQLTHYQDQLSFRTTAWKWLSRETFPPDFKTEGTQDSNVLFSLLSACYPCANYEYHAKCENYAKTVKDHLAWLNSWHRSLSLLAFQAFTLNSKEPWLVRRAILSECNEKRPRKISILLRISGEETLTGWTKEAQEICVCQRVPEKRWRCCWKLWHPGWQLTDQPSSLRRTE